MDVRVDGESIVQDGVAEIPVAGYTSPTQIQRTGLVCVPQGYGISFQYDTHNLIISNPLPSLIDSRNNMWQADYYALTLRRIDYAVKAAMCDGKGAAWTADEQKSARERMGALDTQDMIDITEITMDAETLKYVFPSFADYRILEISFLKTYKATTGLTGAIWLRIANTVGWSITPSYAYNTFTLDASEKSCRGKSITTNNSQLETAIYGLTVDKKYWNSEFREAPYLLLPNVERAQYYAECNTIIKVRGIKR